MQFNDCCDYLLSSSIIIIPHFIHLSARFKTISREVKNAVDLADYSGEKLYNELIEVFEISPVHIFYGRYIHSNNESLSSPQITIRGFGGIYFSVG